MSIQENLTKAQHAATKAYAAYSNFRVGCVVKTKAGNEYHGCNVENISYGLTSCAERNAIFAAVAAEGPSMKLHQVYVAMADGNEGSPCGACRQVIAEFGHDAHVHFIQGGKTVSSTAADLLPYAFDTLG
jgi:cytidine deaminase